MTCWRQKKLPAFYFFSLRWLIRTCPQNESPYMRLVIAQSLLDQPTTIRNQIVHYQALMISKNKSYNSL